MALDSEVNITDHITDHVSLTMRDSMLYISVCGSCKPVLLAIDTTMVHVMLDLSTDSVPYNAHHMLSFNIGNTDLWRIDS